LNDPTISRFRGGANFLLASMLLAGCGSKNETAAPQQNPVTVSAVPAGRPAAAVDEAMILANATTSKEWPSYGLDYAETRFSHLSEINDTNVQNLGLLWTYDLESIRGVEATPLVVDGIMYVTASWSVVHAIDARTGQRLWTYDPQVPRELA
jgi:quinohemoprotein ethanol dehydrogenase